MKKKEAKTILWHLGARKSDCRERHEVGLRIERGQDGQDCYISFVSPRGRLHRLLGVTKDEANDLEKLWSGV